MALASGGRRLSAAALDARQMELDERVVTRKELAAAARDTMKALELRPSVRLVLAELVGCWGERLIGDRIMVWPSNDYIVTRTGLSERAVRYGIRSLVELTLVAPVDSANGKRFAIKKDGQVVSAFGFDLTPIVARCDEWTRLIAAQRAENERLRRMFDEITICRRATQEALDALETHYPRVDRGELLDALQSASAGAPARRAGASDATLIPALEAFRALRARAEQAFYDAACDGKPCPHIETINDTIQSEALQGLGEQADRVEDSSPGFRPPSVRLVLEACPSLLDFSQPIATEVDLVTAGRYLRGSIGAHESAWNEAVELLGPVRAAIVVAITLQLHTDDVANSMNRIKNPGGYFRALMRLVAAGKMNLQTEMLTMARRSGAARRI